MGSRKINITKKKFNPTSNVDFKKFQLLCLRLAKLSWLPNDVEGHISDIDSFPFGPIIIVIRFLGV